MLWMVAVDNFRLWRNDIINSAAFKAILDDPDCAAMKDELLELNHALWHQAQSHQMHRLQPEVMATKKGICIAMLLMNTSCTNGQSKLN
ncbi:hypothetical protein BC832DRAFT_144099 [Gaertneriomyces semiglobifer]|nr:hypothetical protein BC832DRAFT_144099 [Gaertneriomyces semiglobifer]